ncbi:MAG: C-terminal binding protein [Armatimonadota bacterium]|nr:C-terminal binding protein [Armatimonadota bacterium]MDR5703408.1 C-terminal binding protein [Armatimonadota bacterium]MDR7434848.1 C-terminal binding protein [Armatimonadota bacterium]
MAGFKVVVTDYVFPSLDIEREILGAIGAELVPMQATSEEEILEAARDADGLLVCYAPVTRRVIEGLRKCRIIARYGIGVDNVAVDAAAERGIIVTNVPDYCIEEVSDHALALLLACARRISYLDRKVRSGRWEAKDAVPIFRLRGQVLGLVGFGKIPRNLAKKAKALGLEVIAYDPYIGAADMEAQGVEKVELETLLRRADFVSIHTPLTAETRGLIGEAQLRMMKPTAYLINTARGPIVKESALVRALQEGWIAGAALDVLETEPPPRDHSLFALDNVILTPHVGFYSEESLRELQRKAAEEVARVLTGQSPRYPVTPLPTQTRREGGLQ